MGAYGAPDAAIAGLIVGIPNAAGPLTITSRAPPVAAEIPRASIAVLAVISAIIAVIAAD